MVAPLLKVYVYDVGGPYVQCGHVCPGYGSLRSSSYYSWAGLCGSTVLSQMYSYILHDAFFCLNEADSLLYITSVNQFSSECSIWPSVVSSTVPTDPSYCTNYTVPHTIPDTPYIKCLQAYVSSHLRADNKNAESDSI